MPKIRLSVPLVAQEKDNCCWHTSAYMIWLYWQKNGKGTGPMFTIPSSYAVADTTPLDGAQFITLAQNIGLEALPVKNQHSEQDLFDYLTNSGPVWSAGHWFGPGHAIVLTGVDRGRVYFNDPGGGVAKEGTVKWFNERLFKQFPGCLMVKDQQRY
jgi:hypothetical protein